MAGTIKVDIDALEALLDNLKPLRDALDNQQHLAHSLNNQLHTAITGTAHNISTFENTFSNWAAQLNTLTTEIDGAYQALHTVLVDAKDAVHTL